MTTGRPDRRSDYLSLTTFVALGLPDGMLGTAWPSMRQSLHVPVGDLGPILLASTAGAVIVTVLVGAAMRRSGVAPVLAVGLLCAVAASIGFATAPMYGAVAGFAFVFGVAAGALDGGLNTEVGLSGRPRLLNLLHGAYGVGTAIGPLLVTVAIVAGSWRPSYIALAGLDVVLAGLWWYLGRHRRRQAAVAPPPPPVDDPGPRLMYGRRGQAAVVCGILVFFVYTGLEVAAGQWETTFGRGHLHLSPSAAGLATFGYWGALTAVRIGLALLPRPVSPVLVVRVGTLLGLAAAGVIWWQPDRAVTIAAFVVMGGALAGVFPSLIALTPTRLGPVRAQRVIPWQVGAASAGGAGVSAVLGLLIDGHGLGVVGPALAVVAVVLLVGEVVLGRLAPV